MTTTPAAVSELDLARALTLVERSVVQRLGEALKAEGATLEEWRVLSFLGDGTGHAMAEVAEFALLTAPTLTKVVDRMVSLGLVLRRVDDTDRRRVLVFASDRGAEAPPLDRCGRTRKGPHRDRPRNRGDGPAADTAPARLTATGLTDSPGWSTARLPRGSEAPPDAVSVLAWSPVCANRRAKQRTREGHTAPNANGPRHGFVLSAPHDARPPGSSRDDCTCEPRPHLSAVCAAMP